MKGSVGIKDLKVRCLVGVHPHERLAAQEVQFEIEIDFDFAGAARSDALSDTIDYAALHALVVETAETGRFRLLESLAERVSARILDDARVEEVRLCVKKPAAFPDTAWAYARVARRQPR